MTDPDAPGGLLQGEGEAEGCLGAGNVGPPSAGAGCISTRTGAPSTTKVRSAARFPKVVGLSDALRTARFI